MLARAATVRVEAAAVVAIRAVAPRLQVVQAVELPARRIKPAPQVEGTQPALATVFRVVRRVNKKGS